MHENLKQVENVVSQLQSTGSGYDLLRYVCLPDLLGKDANTILYVLGKNIAREIEWKSIEQIVEFFYLTGWGTLETTKEKRAEQIFTLQGRAVTNRMKQDIAIEYRLEAGFLAAAMEKLNGFACECTDEAKPRKNYIELRVQHFR
ncbi:putative hydrocarbon binding protein [Natronobacillus azotifigens]|uniref:YslB family protein n=1 Tax=Natronobacillus azotifigens TaxID=472978 RepID=A0A9J6RG88_9BACI|nr:YslB family protein [Natronobacillus azotifigens]